VLVLTSKPLWNDTKHFTILVNRWPICRKPNEIGLGSKSAKELKKKQAKRMNLGSLQILSNRIEARKLKFGALRPVSRLDEVYQAWDMKVSSP
jgi:hypothetical protein